MKLDLLTKLFDEFEKIKQKILINIDKVVLESEDQQGKAKIIIYYERKENNDNRRSKE